MYKAFVRSGLEYATNVWMGADKSYLGLLDKIQRRAFRILKVTRTDRLKFKLHPLDLRRQVIALGTLYKMHLASCPTTLRELLPKPLAPPKRTLRSGGGDEGYHQHSLDIRSFCKLHKRDNGNILFDTEKFKRSFLFHTVEQWNRLPASIIGEINNQATPQDDKWAISRFKQRAAKHIMPEYHL